MQGKGRTVFDYEKLPLKVRIYRISDTEVGSDQHNPRNEYVLNLGIGHDGKSLNKIVYGQITLPEAVERLFLEIISNAGDNVDESRKRGYDPGVIEITMTNTMIKIRNGGCPIPIEVDPRYGVWTPQLIFGNLVSSSHYDPNKTRTGCGRNGYGAKLANIFSKLFIVRIGNNEYKKEYVQEWRDNMWLNNPDENYCQPPIISDGYNGPNYVEIEYHMDFERFAMTGYTQESMFLFARHAADVSFTSKVPVYFNGMTLDNSDIGDYCLPYAQSDDPAVIIYREYANGVPTVNKKIKGNIVTTSVNPAVPVLEMAVMETAYAGKVISFVNGMCTKEGGVHVEAALKAITTPILDLINSGNPSRTGKGRKGAKVPDEKEEKSTGAKITPSDITPHLTLIIAVRVENPSFKSQTKEFLTKPRPKVNISADALNPMKKWDIVDLLWKQLEAKKFALLRKTDGKSRGRFDDGKVRHANNAGDGKTDCTLIIVEGDSAKSYPTKLLSEMEKNRKDKEVTGRDIFGIWPIRGKIINTMKATVEQLSNSDIICNLKKILKLQEGVDYSDPANFATLNYQRVVILADADDDGKHIIGLVICYFYVRFRSLLQRGYINFMRTPLIRLKRKDGNNKGKAFFTMKEFDEWKLQNPNVKINHGDIKYCKGLGSSSDKEIAGDYPSNIRQIMCVYDDEVQELDQYGNIVKIDRAAEAMNLAFHPTYANQRKEWIEKWVPAEIPSNLVYLPISQFIKSELIEYGYRDLVRSIPNVMDGLKDGQRKALFGILLRWYNRGPNSAKVGKKVKVGNEKIKEKKNFKPATVEIYGSYASSITAYHHGPANMCKTVVNMGQSYVGSNNMPYFEADGQLGSRDLDGKDSAQNRYPSVTPSWWIPYVYREEDDPILKYKEEQEMTIEPEEYLPILNMELINGFSGIAVGFSTFGLKHNPRDNANWLKARLMGQVPTEFIPWYRGFRGTIEVKSKDKGHVVDILPEVQSEIVENVESVENNAESHNKYEDAKEDDRSWIVVKGVFQNTGKEIIVTEIPFTTSIDAYKQFLEKLKTNKKIKSFLDRSTADYPHFIIKGFKEEANHKNLYLQRNLSMTNMVLLDNGRPKKYASAHNIMETFYQKRLPWYQVRKDSILTKLNHKLKVISDKIKVIRLVKDGHVTIINRKKPDVMNELEKTHGINKDNVSDLSLWSLTDDIIEEHVNKLNKTHEDIQKVTNTDIRQMWYNDILAFEEKYNEMELKAEKKSNKKK
ncbi:DNA topoisomerase II [Orpheovirus IHUMI-LCC2]|uniref:DNA topoisomerase 2 n=1 Tax=Orpheovirus IHUMI-LCC2 TaxID=2023057 RepID=A0A2I2L5L0_9VIRU|nr:DNA topoisomerase II [Orpheovirus IHUMI-LCC2]SNW62806.1 Topoisomerase IIA [Orpheovirus IHUMI-LCC2]